MEGRAANIWFTLFDEAGRALAEWKETLSGPRNASIVVDSKEVRARFDLAAIHRPIVHGSMSWERSGHEIVKYALDTYGDSPERSPALHA